MRMHHLGLPAALALTAMLPGAAGADDWNGRWWPQGTLAARVREATKLYTDPSYAMQMGYQPGPCVSGPSGGAMGVHFVNMVLLDDAPPDVDNPEVLIYEPLPGGGYRLAGAEYITFAASPAVLEGHLLHYAPAPNRYGIPVASLQLHVWAWKSNPNGTFADWNPRVSCDAFVPPL